jgi:hypothetical protein
MNSLRGNELFSNLPATFRSYFRVLVREIV